MYYRQGIPQIDLFIEKGTDRTPEPGRYYVFKDGEAQGNARGYHSLKRAQEKYSELLATSRYVPAASNGASPQLTPASPQRAEKGQSNSIGVNSDRRAALREESQYDFLIRSELHWATSSAYKAKRRRR
jgi:hypothetical protein